MPNDERVDVLDRLAEVLRENEGPPEPAPAGRRERARVPGGRAIALAFVALVLVAALVGGITRLVGGTETEPGPGDLESCADAVARGPATFYGVAVPGSVVIEDGGDLGTASTVPCGGGGDGAGQDVPIHAIDGVEPDVAFASTDNTVVYVPAGRCDGFPGWSRFIACLETRLRFDGRSYTAIRVDAPPATTSRLGVAALTRPEGRSRRVEVFQIGNLAPQRAVVTDVDPRHVFVADGVCDEIADVSFGACVGYEES